MSRASATTILLSFPLIALAGCGEIHPTAPADAAIAAPALQQALVAQTTIELEDALASARPGQTILIPAGDYELQQTLFVPDGVTLKGEGTMTFDATSGLPNGIASAGRTTLRSTAGLTGNMVMLGNGAALHSLVIEDTPGRTGGSVIVVASRTAADRVLARIRECEIVNPNLSGVAPAGPAGRALLAYTRNLNFAADPGPDEDAVVVVHMSRSLVRSRGSGVFAVNFAARSSVRIILSGNVIGGGLDATGGTSRPDAVTGASVVVESRGNLYRADSEWPTNAPGWSLIGGSGAPIPGLAVEATTANSLRVLSIDDRIESFSTAILAAGSTRFTPLSGPISSNGVKLELHRTRLHSATQGQDLVLIGARALLDGNWPDDDNTLHVLVRGVIGSGTRGNVYLHTWTPELGAFGIGNRLEFVGNRSAFDATNRRIDPAPAEMFFNSSR